MKPACMDSAEFLLWQEANERLWGLGNSDSPCRDCTPLWHADMVAGGMCDGVPLPETRPSKKVGAKPVPLDGSKRDYWRLRRRESRERARAAG
jgi:hypothetical protein